METLADAYPKQQARCRELLALYQEIPTGGFGAMMIEQVLQRADNAAAETDIVAMVRSFAEMKECK